MFNLKLVAFVLLITLSLACYDRVCQYSSSNCFTCRCSSNRSGRCGWTGGGCICAYEKENSTESINEKMNSRLERAMAIYRAQKVDLRGCSGFISEVLGIRYEDANSIMGNYNPTTDKIGSNLPFRATPGMIVGWRDGHVAIYMGENYPGMSPGKRFIDINGADKPEDRKPRQMGSYGRELYKSKKYN